MKVLVFLFNLLLLTNKITSKTNEVHYHYHYSKLGKISPTMNRKLSPDLDMFKIPGKKFTIRCKKTNRFIGQQNGTRNITQNQKFHQEGDFWTLTEIKANTYFITNVKTGKVLDIEGGSTAPVAKLIEYPKHGGVNQQFVLVRLSDSSFKIMSVKSKLVLDIEGGSLAAGGQVIQYPFHGGDNQRFYLE